jgi:hypothetical protein
MTETTTGAHQMLGRFYLSGTGDLVYDVDGDHSYIISNQPVLQPVMERLTYAKEQGVHPTFPSHMGALDVYEALADTLYLLEVTRSGLRTAKEEKTQAAAAATRHRHELDSYKKRVRTALVDAWDGHKNHITRSELNEFLEGLGLDPLPLVVRKATVRVWAYQDVEVEDLEVDDEDGVEDAVKEHAQDETDTYSWEVDSDKTEVQDDIEMVED